MAAWSRVSAPQYRQYRLYCTVLYCTAVPAVLYCTVLHCTVLQYRLCPGDQELTEECFQKMPLEFVGQQGFMWGVGAEHWFTGTYVRWSCAVLGII